MATVWITYAWKDNEHGDVDFVAQELGRSGVTVKLDRWNLAAGKRLWEQIDSFISRPDQSDAWLLIATDNSLASEPCKEELAYALDRALKVRGAHFPVIALFLSRAEPSLISTAIRSRLYVSVTDPDWKERVVAAVKGRAHNVNRPDVQPFYCKVHSPVGMRKKYAVELRPRAGVWAPFLAGIPHAEKGVVQPSIMFGPRDRPTDSGMLTMCGDEPSPDGSMWLMFAGNQSTPTESYYVWCNALPSQLRFGVNGREPQYTISGLKS